MIILDTNVISAAVLPDPPPEVARWLRFVPSGEPYTTAIAEAELRYGAYRATLWKKVQELEPAIERMFTTCFANRVLPFDSNAAKEFPAVLIAMQRDMRAFSVSDAQIAAIAVANGATIATRDYGFDRSGVPLINPWTA